MKRITDEKAIELALKTAIDYEKSFIESYRDRHTGVVDTGDEVTRRAVDHSRRLIKAYRRVLQRHFGTTSSIQEEIDEKLKDNPSVSVYDLSRDPPADK